MSQPPPPNRLSTLGGLILVLYLAGFLGVIAAIVSVAKLDVSNALKFVFTAISLMLAVLCFAVGIFVDVQRL